MDFRKSMLFAALLPAACATDNPILDEFQPVPATPIVEAPNPSSSDVANLIVIKQVLTHQLFRTH